MDKKTKALTPDPNAQFYSDILLCCVPLLAVSVYLYGVRALTVALVAILTGNIIDRVVALCRSRAYDPTEHSSECFALLLSLLMPASIHYYVVVVAVLAADLFGKEVFGGAGCYPFHPAAVGYAVAAISWPEQVFRYPVPFAPLPIYNTDAVVTVESASSTLSNGGLPTISTLNLLLGNYAGPMGTAFTCVILACALFLLLRGDIDWITPLCFLAVSAAFVWCFPRLGDLPLSWPWQYAPSRLSVLKYEGLSGAMLFSAVFLVCEPVTVPRTRASRVVYGLFLGFLTMLLRYYGSYETGVCFALLLANSISGWLDRAVQRIVSKKEVRRLEA